MVAFIYAIGALVTLAFFVSRTWFTPQDAMLFAGVGIFLPTIAIALATRNSMQMVEKALVVLSLVVVVIAAGAWNTPKVRIKVVRFYNDPQLLLVASEDQDESVQLAACTALVNSEYPKRDLVFFLNSHPKIAGRCIEGAQPERAKSIAPALAKDWKDTLKTKGDDRACETATALASLAETSKSQVVLELTDCAMDPRSNPEGQKCCGQALQNMKRKDLVVGVLKSSAESLSPTGAMRGLLALNYGEPTVTARHRSYASYAGLVDESLKEPFVLNSCRTLLAGRGDHLYATLKWVLNNQTQCLDPELVDVAFDLELACNALIEITKGEIDDRICKAGEKARITRRAEEAAIPEPNEELGNLAGLVAAGKEHQRKTINLSNFIEDATSQGAPGFGAYSREDLQVIGDEIRGQLPGNLDPDAMRKDVAAAKEKMQKMKSHAELGRLFDDKVSKAEVEAIRKKGEALDEKMKGEAVKSEAP